MPSSLILDPTTDTNLEELARLVKVYSVPEFVKKAQLDGLMRPPAGVVTTFADPRFQRFPCHSAAATWLSAAYFQEKKANLHVKDQRRIQQRLEDYVDYHGIRPAYTQLCKEAADLHKEAELPDDVYAYLWVDEGGRKERHLPMTNAMRVKAAAEWLQQYRDAIPFHDRNTIACRILEKAAKFGAALDAEQTHFLEKQAGRGVCDPKRVVTLIQGRAKLARDGKFREQLLKLANTVRSQPRQALQPDQLVKLAVTLDMADRALGLTDKYTELIPRPEDVIFEATFTKVAADRDELCALTTGNVYTKEQFQKLSRDDVEGMFGTDFADEVCAGSKVDAEKMAELAHTLPLPDAELLDRLMADLSHAPVMQKAASQRHGLSNDELEALAASYAG